MPAFIRLPLPQGPFTSSPLTRNNDLYDGGTIPKLLYGTAWKKENTAELVYQAIKAGFRGIDTAAQPKHYREDLVGEGIRRAIAEGVVSRRDLFIQTKFTPISGQDPSSLPYDASATVGEQVTASVESSLANLATPDCPKPYIDCLVLHSPMPSRRDTLEVWMAMTGFIGRSQVARLGVSNAAAADLTYLLSLAADWDGSFAGADEGYGYGYGDGDGDDEGDGEGERVVLMPRPAVVQNRFYPDTGYDARLRADPDPRGTGRASGIVFQAFWVLTGDRGAMLRRPPGCVRAVAEACTVGAAVAKYALILGLGGISVLDGTSSPEHMAADLQGLERVGLWAASEVGRRTWEAALREFRVIVGDAPPGDGDGKDEGGASAAGS